MGIFTSLFKNKKDLKVSNDKLINLFTPFFSDRINPELNDTFMSCVNTHAKHISKIKPTSYLKDVPAKQWLTNILSLSPNPTMEAGTFWEKAAQNYYLENNLFIYLDWDLSKPKEPLKSIWILDPTLTDVSTNGEEIYLKFNLNGSTITTSLDNIVHIARNVNKEEFFGKTNQAINHVLKIINTNYQGIEQAIKSSAYLRFVLSSTTLMSEKERQKKAQDFAETYLAKDGTGIAYLDSSTTLTQVNSQAKYANAEEMKVFEEKILRYMSISDSILKSDFNENQWQAYYESNIETFTNKLANELTIKLFTDREIGDGNRIIIQSDSLQVASTQTKINLIEKTKELGIFTINEYRQLFNMSPIESGDKRLMSLNYINSDNADQYQLNKNNGGKKDESEPK